MLFHTLALEALAFATCLVLAGGLSLALFRRRIYAFLFAGLLGYQALGMFMVPGLLAEYGGGPMFTAGSFALIGAIVLVCATELAERLLRAEPSRSVRDPTTEPFEHVFIYWSAVAIAATVIVAVTALRGSELFEFTWEEAREGFTMLDSLATLLLFAAFPAVWIALRSGAVLLSALVIALTLASFAVYGSRSALLTIPALIACGLLRGRRVTISWKLGTILVGIAAVFVVLHVVGRLIRGVGLGGVTAFLTGDLQVFAYATESLGDIDWTGGEIDIARYYLFVVAQSPVEGVEPLATPTRWLTMYLPRSVAGLFKPEDPTYALWQHAVNTGLFDGDMFANRLLDLLFSGGSGSLHPGFWGEVWMNGGWAALPVMCLILAIWAVAVDRIVEAVPAPIPSLAAPAIAVGYLMVARGNSTIGLGYAAYLLPLACVLYVIACVPRALLIAGFTHGIDRAFRGESQAPRER